ncbi:MAG: hypothetical protein Kow0042_08560 [Calditrichia bacterium]
MKKNLVLLIMLALSGAIFAQSSFETAAAIWHKNAIMTCGMLKKMETFNQKVMLQKLADLNNGLNDLQNNYANYPPEAYKNDPMWKMYFMLFQDNLKNIKEHVNNKQYQLAQVYCANICKTFGRMHRNNGTTDLTDVMFSLRMEIMGRMEMFSAQNFEGAKTNLSAVENLLNKMNNMAKGQNNYTELFTPLNASVSDWISAMKNGNHKKVKESLGVFVREFPKAYLSTL